jgi:O-antigen ligase
LYGTDESTGNPDWLGEIFEWLSCGHEMGIVRRDGVGRIPYSEMIFGRQNISPRKPHALLLMAWMESALRGGRFTADLPRAQSPLPESEHIVVCSHDIDFYYANWRSALVRLVKNLGIAYHPYRSWSYFLANSRMLLDLLGGRRIGDYLPRLLEASTEEGFTSTLFIAPGNGHRRDPNYRLEHLAPHLPKVSRKGFAVDLHSSYTSVIESAELGSEVAALEKVLGKKPIGNRQHWLRFDHPEKLFRCVASACLKFDSTLGFSDMVGFRNGASFAFPPYDFANERPFERVYSTMSNPNVLGQLMTWCLVVFTLAALYRVGNRAVNVGMVCACTITLVLTGSRFGLLTAGLGLVMIVVLPSTLRRRSTQFLPLLLFLPIFAVTVQLVSKINGPTLERFQSLWHPLEVDSLRSRTDDQWRDAANDFFQSPVVGHGPLKTAFTGVVTDSEYLDVLKEFGIVGFLAYMPFYLLPLFLMWRGLRSGRLAGSLLEAHIPATFLFLRVGIVMILTALLMNVALTTFYNQLLQAFLWIWMGLGVRSAKTISDSGAVAKHRNALDQ